MARRLSGIKRVTIVISSVFKAWKKFCKEDLPSKLPTQLKEALNCDPQLCELVKEVQTLTLTAGADNTLNKAKKCYANHLKKIKSKALRQYQEHWV